MRKMLYKSGTLEIIFLILLALKAFNIIELSWLEVCYPLIIYIICETIKLVFDCFKQYKKSQQGESKK